MQSQNFRFESTLMLNGKSWIYISKTSFTFDALMFRPLGMFSILFSHLFGIYLWGFLVPGSVYPTLNQRATQGNGLSQELVGLDDRTRKRQVHTNSKRKVCPLQAKCETQSDSRPPLQNKRLVQKFENISQSSRRLVMQTPNNR